MYLYAIQDSSTGYVKLGYSNDPDARVKSLQTGNSQILQLIYKAKVIPNRARVLEQKLHHEFKHLQIRGEWFSMSQDQARQLIDYIIIRYEDDVLI
jgi:hypothetical protein